MATTETGPDPERNATRRWPRRLGLLTAAAAAVSGAVAYLRHRSRQVGPATLYTDRVERPGVVHPDERPDLVHAPGHRHRLRPPPDGPRPTGTEHAPAPDLRHRDRGGRSTAFHTRRSS